MRFCFALLAAISLVGCSSEPKAPPLIDSSVFQSDEEGFRFLVPEEWRLLSRANLPSGVHDREHLVVKYQRIPPLKPGTIEVSRFDTWQQDALPEIVARPSHGCNHWKMVDSPESIEVQGNPATRFHVTGTIQNQKMAKETVVLKRKERGYFFVVLYLENESSARDQFRRVINGLIWQK